MHVEQIASDCTILDDYGTDDNTLDDDDDDAEKCVQFTYQAMVTALGNHNVAPAEMSLARMQLEQAIRFVMMMHYW